MRLNIAGLNDPDRVAAVKRSLNLVAGVTGIQVDADRGQVILEGDPSETLVLVHLANEGFQASIVHEAPEHPRH